MANDLDVTLGFQGEDEGANALVRQMLAGLRQLQAEERAARAEDRRARQQAREQAAVEARARRQEAQAARQAAAAKRTAASQDRQSAAAAARAARERVAAERAAARAQRDSEIAARRNAAALRDQGGAAGGTSRLVGALGRQLALLAASLGAAFSVQRILSAGLSLNETIETSTLGIASLINAQTELVASDGRVLEGREKLDGAFAIATEQVNQLRIAGLTTAATTTQLVEAFQQAVGAGTSAGLAMDQVRRITILAIQAATALGVPLNQLNQEVRALLEGTIDRNARVATALQITGQEVTDARAAGQLFEFLNERLSSFAVSGEAVAGTLAGIRSNVAEVLQTFAAFASAPLFDRLKEIGAETFEALFSSANLSVQKEFEGVIQLGRAVSTAVADVLGRTVAGLLAAAQRMGQFFEENELSVRAVLAAGGDVLAEIGRLVVAAGELTAEILGTGQTSEAFAGILQGLAIIISVVRENLGLLTAAFVIFKARAIAVLIPTLAALGPVAATITVVATAVGLLTAALGVLEVRRRAQQQAQIRAAEAQGAEATEVARLTREYTTQADAINSGALKGDELARARTRLKEIADDLIAISPDYIDTFTEEGRSATETAKQLQELNTQRLLSINLERLQAQNRVNALTREERRLRRELEGARRAGPRNAARSETEVRRELRRVEDELEHQRELADTLRRSFESARDAAAGIEVPGITPGRGTGAGTGTGTENDLEQQVAAETRRIEAALAQQKELLDRQLADGLLSYREYYARLGAETESAISAQLVQQRRLLAGATDAGERAQISQQIEALEAERAQATERFARERLSAEQELADQVTQLTIRLYEAEGDAVTARNLRLEAEFRDLRRRLEAEGDAAGLAILNRLINLEQARTRIGRLEDEIRAVREDLSIEERRIELAQQTGAISGAEAQRQLADAYRRTADRIRATLPLVRQLAEAAGTDEARRQVAALELESARLDQQAAQLADTMASFRNDARQALVSDLSQFLARGEQGVASFAEAVGRLLGNVAQSLRDLLAERAAEQFAASLFEAGGLFGPERQQAGAPAAAEAAVQAAADIGPSIALLSSTATTLTAGSAALTTAAGALAVPTTALAPGAAALTAAAGALVPATVALNAAAASLLAAAAALTVARAGVGFAHGGYVSGPARPVDSIPIWVTGGEYVINPESTRRHRALLESINRDRSGQLRGDWLVPVQRHTRNSFVQGGLVADARAGASRETGGGRDRASLSVEASPDLIVRQLKSQRGESAWLDVAIKHRRALRDLLRDGR